jgi:hypothetical protein
MSKRKEKERINFHAFLCNNLEGSDLKYFQGYFFFSCEEMAGSESVDCRLFRRKEEENEGSTLREWS